MSYRGRRNNNKTNKSKPFGQFTRTDRFGNYTILVNCKDNKKNADFNAGYFEFKGKLLKVEVTENNKEGAQYWAKITELDD